MVRAIAESRTDVLHIAVRIGRAGMDQRHVDVDRRNRQQTLAGDRIVEFLQPAD